MKPLLPFSLVLLTCVAVSCGRKDPTPAELATARQQKDRAKDDAYRWFVNNTVGAYERIGKHDPQWDGDAKAALNLIASASAGRPVPDDWQHQVSAFAQSALDHGCTDPYIRYAAVRYGIPNVKQAGPALAKELQEAVQQLVGTEYPARIQFHATQRALEAMLGALSHKQEEQTQAEHFALNQMANNIQGPYLEALRDITTPPEEIYEICLSELRSSWIPTEGFPHIWEETDRTLRETGHKSNIRELLKGWFHIQYAWRARGGGFGNEVTAEGARLFEERLKIAEQALQSAWNMDNTDTRPATLMLEVCVGLGKERPEMERWFRRAMLAAPNNDEACRDKLHYLKPIWYGSPEDMLDFGHECITNTNWKGTVPLIMVDVHSFLSTYGRKDKKAQQAYWEQPEVWQDIRAAYEEFFRREPDAVGWRHDYAWYAYKCQAWDDLNAQLRLLGRINYDYFGGQAVFRQMVEDAKKHAKP